MSEFKPTKVEKTVISIRIDTDTLEKIDKLSNDADISRNEFILQCIDFAMKNLKQRGKIAYKISFIRLW